MSIKDYIKNLKKNSCYYKEISAMTFEELEIERSRLRDLISTYDSWGPAQSINTDKYFDVCKLIWEFDA